MLVRLSRTIPSRRYLPSTPPCPQTFPAHEVLARRLDGRAANVVEAGVQLARERIARLGRLLRGGGVTIEVCEWQHGLAWARARVGMPIRRPKHVPPSIPKLACPLPLTVMPMLDAAMLDAA